MKAEDNSQPLPTTYATSQWNSSSIPIDPALQQQSTSSPVPPQQAQHTPTPQYTHYQYQHYTQPAYGHFQHQAYVAPQTSTQQTYSTTATTTAPKPSATTSATDTTDVSKLNDALGSAGVDLRAEEETLQRSFDQYQAYRPYEDRSRKQPTRPHFDTRNLGTRIREIGTQLKVTKVPEDSVNYIALSLRARLQELIEAMIEASQHRQDSQFERPASHYEDGTPMWSLVIRADVSKQLAAIEKVEREEELKVRRERKERADMAAAHAAALASQANGTAMSIDATEPVEDGQPKKKKKKVDGPGVTARNMSEDVRKKMSNAVASQAAGLGQKYAWMSASTASTPAPKPKPATSTANAGLSSATTTTPASTAGGSWARPYVSALKGSQASAMPGKEDDKRRAITIRDAMFVIEKERGHGGGKGSARGWT
ncbi:transcription initiation factor TFIID component TAF4 family-domain-containing protein [Irpex rosettiformis]|uniref:Transcription initiation factor TFIID component TAF4 family-domain-containing protein n=1 Tax=Irpex rosettiformis TaxID=378272 RepID=A0ACB8UCN8_9APHY|nr:transcription initiation factor TFIID component TAF4 family-domain-containing protein [Irpex rosettiformis]